MVQQRRRNPPPPKAVCVRCGWRGTPNHASLPNEYGDAALVVFEKACPACGSPVVQLGEPKLLMSIQLVTAIREADFTADQLQAVADAIREAPEGTSPRALAEQVPFASRLITVASRAGEHWLELLVIAVTVVALAIGHSDQEQAHRDAQRAHRDAEREHRDAERAHEDAMRADREARRDRKSSSLTEGEIRRLARQIEEEAQASDSP